MALNSSTILWLQLLWGVLALAMVLRLLWRGLSWLGTCPVPAWVHWLVRAVFLGSMGVVLAAGLLLLISVVAAGWD